MEESDDEKKSQINGSYGKSLLLLAVIIGLAHGYALLVNDYIGYSHTVVLVIDKIHY